MKNLNRGITLIEIMVAVVLIAIIVGIFVANFPMLKLRLALSRTTHLVAQDIKTAQNLSGSGHREKLPNGDLVLPKGYGIYINLTETMGNKNYIIYADVNGDRRYNGESIDFKVKEISLSNYEPGIIIKAIHNANSRLSVNFAPPNFNTTISDLLPNHDGVEIIIGAESNQSVSDRIIYVNKAGLIEVK